MNTTTRQPMACRRAADAEAYKAWLRAENHRDIATFLLGCAVTTLLAFGVWALLGVHP